MINEYFSHTALINLKKREDRLQSATKVLDEFGVNYEVWEATENEVYPCRGLVDSMQRYFRKALAAGGTRCLVFEDDISPLVDAQTFNETVNKCIEQLPSDWDLFYLGGNVASGLQNFYSENLFPVRFVYATHATAYSKKAMEFVCSKIINEPVDNCMVRDFMPHKKIFISYPMLLTQKPDYSDIGKAFTDWSNFLHIKYEAEVRRLKPFNTENI